MEQGRVRSASPAIKEGKTGEQGLPISAKLSCDMHFHPKYS